MRKWIIVLLVLLMPSLSFGADFYSSATAIVQVRSIINETTASFWTDTELGNFIKQGVEDITARSLCLQVSDTIALVTAQNEYATTVGAVSVVDIVKVWGAFYISPDNEYIGLKRIEPSWIADLPFMISGPAKYFYHFADKIGILPLPSAAENTKTVRIYFSKMSQDIADLPNQYQELAITYAVSMAYKKEHRFTESNAMYGMYLQKVTALKQELYGVPLEPKSQ